MVKDYPINNLKQIWILSHPLSALVILKLLIYLGLLYTTQIFVQIFIAYLGWKKIMQPRWAMKNDVKTRKKYKVCNGP